MLQTSSNANLATAETPEEALEMIKTFVPEAELLSFQESVALAEKRNEQSALELKVSFFQFECPEMVPFL